MTNFEQIVIEIEKSIVLSVEEKREYLKKFKDLPDNLLVNILKKFRETNAQMDGYIKTALENDTDGTHLKTLKRKLAFAKKQLLGKEEAAEQPDPETILKQI